MNESIILEEIFQTIEGVLLVDVAVAVFSFGFGDDISL